MCPQKPFDADIPASGLGSPNPIEHHPSNPTDLVATDAEKEAYERGVRAGQEESNQKNPYPENSVQAKAYDHGYLDGQKMQLGNTP